MVLTGMMTVTTTTMILIMMTTTVEVDDDKGLRANRRCFETEEMQGVVFSSQDGDRAVSKASLAA